jgi:hypothetical protein
MLGGFIGGIGVATFNAVYNGSSFSQFGSDVAFCTIAGGLMGTGTGIGLGMGMLAEVGGLANTATSVVPSTLPILNTGK